MTLAFYDRAGNRVSALEALPMFSNQKVCSDDIAGYGVSTMHLVASRGRSLTNRPLIFETMVFSPEGEPLGRPIRTATIEGALAVHNDICRSIRVRLS